MITNLSKNIKILRKENDFSQSYMAEELGMSRPTYAQIERDEREITIAEAEKIAAIFGISLSDFLSGEKSQPKIIIEQREEEASKKSSRL